MMKIFKNLKLLNNSRSSRSTYGSDSNRVYFELPSIEILYRRDAFPWHLQAIVQFDFDVKKIKKLQMEIELQMQIGQEISRMLDCEALKYIKVGSYIKNGAIIHDFYLDCCLNQPNLRSTKILTGIMCYRNVSFDINLDKKWKNSRPYFNLFGCDNVESLFEKLLNLNSPYALVN